MTDQQPKLGQSTLEFARQPLRLLNCKARTNGEAIQAGLSFLGARWQDGRWQDSSQQYGGPDTWVTAYVLARLADVSPEYKCPHLQYKIESSLLWLEHFRSRQGCWGSRPGEDDDATSTAWAVVALRRHGRPAPPAALDFLRRCRRFDGGFGALPVEGSNQQTPSIPEITAVAVNALSCLDWDTEDFLAAFLRDSKHQAARFRVCAKILEWREGLAPASLLRQVRQLVAGFSNDGALDRALLLRCLLRLGMQRAWRLAADLRAMQTEEGSWSEQDGQEIIATVTAVSALVLGESQPGLYFGSDRPLPRRLHNRKLHQS